MASRKKDQERLERELCGEGYQALLRKLQKTAPLLCRFRTWADVLGFMHTGSSRDPRKDDILRPIFRAHSKDQDPRWRTVLLTVFWPGLQSIHWQKRGWDADPDEHWSNIVWTFLQVVCRIDVEKRPHRLVQKVFNDTVHRLYDEYRRQWNRSSRERLMQPDDVDVLAGGVEGIDFVAIELREAQEAEIKRLRAHMKEGRISEADFLLLVGTRVYGKSVADYSREEGLNYQMLKKRRQRAEAAITRHEREMRKNRDFLSP